MHFFFRGKPQISCHVQQILQVFLLHWKAHYLEVLSILFAFFLFSCFIQIGSFLVPDIVKQSPVGPPSMDSDLCPKIFLKFFTTALAIFKRLGMRTPSFQTQWVLAFVLNTFLSFTSLLSSCLTGTEQPRGTLNSLSDNFCRWMAEFTCCSS